MYAHDPRLIQLSGPGKATICDKGGFWGYLHLRIQRSLKNRSKFSSSPRKKLKLGDKMSALTHPAKAVAKSRLDPGL